MENDREVDSVLMNVKQTTGSVISVITFSARMTWKLLTIIGRLAKKGLIAGGICDRFKDFHTKTGGEYNTYNIPLSEEKSKMIKEMQKIELQLENERNPIAKADLKKRLSHIEKSIPEIQQLKKLGITYCMLPKINGSMNTIQVAIANKDEQHFKNWFLNHLTTNMSGGGKSIEALKVFTEGNYSTFNMPFEKAEELGDMLHDFEAMGVNFSILTDLNVGDGYTQVAISNSDRTKVEQWFNMWKQKALSQGQEANDMYAINEDAYTSTAEISPEEYINQAEPEFQAVEQAFEAESKEIPWKAKLSKDNSPEFVKFMQDDNYEKITINIDSLVNNKKDNYVAKAFEEKHGFFVSRVPATYGDNQKLLILPPENVFTTDNNKTVVAFLDKRKSYYTIGNDGKAIKLPSADIKEYYAKVNRGISKAEALTKEMAQELSKNPKPTKPIL